MLVSVAPRPDRRLSDTDHQPSGRQKMDCDTSTACTRPGGTISVTVVNSPKVMRTPLRVGAIEYRSERVIRRKA